MVQSLGKQKIYVKITNIQMFVYKKNKYTYRTYKNKSLLPSNIWIKTNDIVGEEYPNTNFQKSDGDFQDPDRKSICPWREKEVFSMLVEHRKPCNYHGKFSHSIEHDHKDGIEQRT